MTDQLQLRSWQQIKQAQALEYAGTPEGSAALIESRRYGLAADRIDEMAAQVEALRSALELAVCTCFDQYSLERVLSDPSHFVVLALALPNNAAVILRQRDARVLREAADVCAGMFEGQDGAVHVASMRCADALRDRADELESKK